MTINGAKCQGHGRCAMIAPSLFDLDDAGQALVLLDPVPGSDLPDVEEAVMSCPEQAIALAD
ncbi:MAG TPA: ferredoxin [Pseudonocardia sp.]|nr:ferredoxin [Pseudonocardia sp.]